MEKPPSHDRANEKEPFWSCRDCHSDKVHPLSWSEVGATHWHVSLRCGECEARFEIIESQTNLDIYDVELHAAIDSIERDVTLLDRARFADDIDNFVRALEQDGVVPEDF